MLRDAKQKFLFVVKGESRDLLPDIQGDGLGIDSAKSPQTKVDGGGRAESVAPICLGYGGKVKIDSTINLPIAPRLQCRERRSILARHSTARNRGS